MSQTWNKIPEEEQEAPAGESDLGATGEGEGKTAAFNSGTLLLIAVFLAGLGMIYLLGLESKPRSAAAAQQADNDAQLDAAIAQLTGKTNQTEIQSLFKDTHQLVKIFYEYPGPSAVPINQLPSTPFEQDTGAPKDNTANAPADDGSYAERQQMAKAAQSFSGLKLQTIIYSRTNPQALINDHVLGVGSRIGEFTVAAIHPQTVTLKFGKAQYELHLEGMQ